MSGGPVPVWKKYTTRPQGIWEKIRQLLVLVPNRSSGNPLVSLFRNVPPGERVQQAREYKDPVTIPAGDIKGNPYFKRDHRRQYPQVHSFNQTKVSGLLTLGNAQQPRISVGEKGQKELAPYKQVGGVAEVEEVSLATTLSQIPESVIKGEVLGKQGEPIVAPSLNKFKWQILPESVHGMYTEEYPCRIFTDVKSVRAHPKQQSYSPI